VRNAHKYRKPSQLGAEVDMNAPDLRVCYVIASFHPVTGGAEIATRKLCEELSRRGVDAVVLTRRRPGLAKQERIGQLSVFRAGHPSTSKAGALTFIVHGLWILRTRLRRYSLLHVQNLDAPLVLGVLARLLFRRTLFVTSHGQRRLVAAIQNRWGGLPLRFMCRLVHQFAALSPDMERQLLAVGVPSSQISIIPNGVDTAVYRPPNADEKRRARGILSLNETAAIAVFVGRLVQLKRVDLLLRAWGSLPGEPEAQLLVLGDGPERRVLESLAADLGLSTVRFEGSTDDVGTYLQASDLFILPSEHEGLSVALLEAMATGLAALVTDLPGNRALVKHESNGIIVPVADLSAIRDGLHRLICDRSLRERLGGAARKTVGADYGLSSIADRHTAVYRRVLVSSRTPVPGPAAGDRSGQPIV
jgi:glycosyltransferase involved in cell wall biosynthesis